MKILYFDCFAGISGDMTLGAFLDLGVSDEKLISELCKLNVEGYKIIVTKKAKNGIVGTDVNVVLEGKENNEEQHHDHHNGEHKHEHNHHNHGNSLLKVESHGHINHGGHIHRSNEEHHHRSFEDIRKLIETSALDTKVKKLSIKIFYNVAKAEGKIHGKPLEEVHFHEVGAIDSIVDIVGTAICLNELNIDKVVCSPLHIGMGTVMCQHGVIPVPAPATLEILKDGKVPVYTTGVKKETVTPTGAAIISTLVDEFSSIPEGIVTAIGYGAGKRDTEIANMLRLIIVENNGLASEAINVVEANIDDMTGEVAGFTMEKLLQNKALDVFYTPIFMKKNRPAYKLSVLCKDDNLENIKRIILKETTTIGIRSYKTHRTIMERKIEKINTCYGDVRIKVTSFEDIIKVAPEYEDCRAAAIKNGVSLITVYDEAKKEYYNRI